MLGTVLQWNCAGDTVIELLANGDWGRSALAADVAADPGSLTGRRVARAAADGDAVALAAYSQPALSLGQGLAMIADIFDPDLIVLAGGVGASSGLFLDEAREHYARLVTGAGYRQLARIRGTQSARPRGDRGGRGRAAGGDRGHRPAVRHRFGPGAGPGPRRNGFPVVARTSPGCSGTAAGKVFGSDSARRQGARDVVLPLQIRFSGPAPCAFSGVRVSRGWRTFPTTDPPFWRAIISR